LLLGCGAGTDKSLESAMKVYPSPRALFEAYRDASRHGDWQAIYHMSTSEAQRNMVFESYFACGEVSTPALKALQDKFGPSEATLGKTLREEYGRKHGADIGQGETAGNAARDQDLLRQVFFALTKDKVGFFTEVQKELNKQGGRSLAPVIAGDLEDLTVNGDTATGRVVVRLFHLGHDRGGGPEREVETTSYTTFHFRRVKRGWLLGH
jgi:hypothetical protein